MSSISLYTPCSAHTEGPNTFLKDKSFPMRLGSLFNRSLNLFTLILYEKYL